jgi:Fur family transcriptional regulator, ferric uptake regulator
MTTTHSSSSPQDFRALLHQHKLRATPARLRVLSMLQKHNKPISIQDLHEQMRSLAVDQATLYRMLGVFTQKGIVRQIDLRHGHAHYELAGEGHHHHIICEVCGRIEDVSGCDFEPFVQEALRHSTHFSRIDQHSIEFFGVCVPCQKARKRNQASSSQ